MKRRPRYHGTHEISLLAATAMALATVHAQAQVEDTLQPTPHIEFDMSVLTTEDPFLQGTSDKVYASLQAGMEGYVQTMLDSRTSLQAQGQLGYRKYDSDFGSYLTGNFYSQLDYRDDERFALRTILSYLRELPLESTALSIDSALDPVALQNRAFVSQDAIWTPDARTTLTGSISAMLLAPEHSSVLDRTFGTTLTLQGKYELDTRTWVGGESRFSNTRSHGQGNPNAQTFLARAGARPLRYLKLESNAGVSWIARSYDTGQQRHSPPLFTGMIEACYDPRRLDVCFSARIDPILTSFGGIQREKAISAKLSWRLGEADNFLAEANFRAAPRTSSSGVRLGGDTQISQFSARLDHQFGEHFVLHTGANYYRRSGIDGGSIDTWTLEVGLKLRIP